MRQKFDNLWLVVKVACGVTMTGSPPKIRLIKVLLYLSWRPCSSHQVHLPYTPKASFLPAQHFGNWLCLLQCHYFQAAVCIMLIYILTWFKSTHLSDIIITHLLQGKTPFFLHLRRAATGVAHRRPANTPPAPPSILLDSAHTAIAFCSAMAAFCWRTESAIIRTLACVCGIL